MYFSPNSHTSCTWVWYMQARRARACTFVSMHVRSNASASLAGLGGLYVDVFDFSVAYLQHSFLADLATLMPAHTRTLFTSVAAHLLII